MFLFLIPCRKHKKNWNKETAYDVIMGNQTQILVVALNPLNQKSDDPTLCIQWMK